MALVSTNLLWRTLVASNGHERCGSAGVLSFDRKGLIMTVFAIRASYTCSTE